MPSAPRSFAFRTLCGLLSLCAGLRCGRGAGTGLGGFWGLYGRRNPLQGSQQQSPCFGVGLALSADLPAEILNLSFKSIYQSVRSVVWLVGGRTRLVGGRTVLIHQDVDGPTFPFYGKCAPTYATTYGLGADPEYLSSPGYGRTAYWLRTVLSHAPIVRYQKTPRKALEDDLAPLKRSWNLLGVEGRSDRSPFRFGAPHLGRDGRKG
jgi:hypothetical protein